VPEGASIKKSEIPFNETFIFTNKVNSFFERSQPQFLEVPLMSNRVLATIFQRPQQQ
jgi:hypothetical protein